MVNDEPRAAHKIINLKTSKKKTISRTSARAVGVVGTTPFRKKKQGSNGDRTMATVPGLYSGFDLMFQGV